MVPSVRWSSSITDGAATVRVEEARMILRVYWQLRGEHVHMRVFAGRDAAFKLAGTLVLSASEFMELAKGSFKPEFYEVKEKPNEA